MAEIRIPLRETQIPGQLEPKVVLDEIPGGWETAVDILIIALRIVHQEAKKARTAEHRVVLADAMPNGGLH